MAETAQPNGLAGLIGKGYLAAEDALGYGWDFLKATSPIAQGTRIIGNISEAVPQIPLAVQQAREARNPPPPALPTEADKMKAFQQAQIQNNFAGRFEGEAPVAPETPTEAPQSLADQLNEYKAALGGSGGQTAENPYRAELATFAKPQTKGEFLTALGMGMMGKPTFFEGASAGLAAALAQGDKAKASYYEGLVENSRSFDNEQNRAAEVENNRQRNAISLYEAKNPAASDKLNPLVKYNMELREKAAELAIKAVEDNPEFQQLTVEEKQAKIAELQGIYMQSLMRQYSGGWNTESASGAMDVRKPT